MSPLPPPWSPWGARGDAGASCYGAAMELDWGDGDYSHTAVQLEQATERALALADVRKGERVLDLGCGNGNVTLAGAKLGAQLTAVDPSLRLLEAAQQRAQNEGIEATFHAGEGARIPATDDSFDAVIAVFSIIFAPDAEACVREMWRVVRPGGRLVITSWVAEGAIFDMSELLKPKDAPPNPSPWPFPDKIRALFQPYPASPSITQEILPFEAESAKAWFDSVEAHHPVWRMLKSARADEWPEIRRRSIDILQSANENEKGFRSTSKYWLTRVDVP